jgi:hypothetical protein
MICPGTKKVSSTPRNRLPDQWVTGVNPDLATKSKHQNEPNQRPVGRFLRLPKELQGHAPYPKCLNAFVMLMVAYTLARQILA